MGKALMETRVDELTGMEIDRKGYKCEIGR